MVPLLDAAQKLLIREISDVETIDKTWTVGTGAPLGPFAILDVVGINAAYNIGHAKAEAMGDPELEKIAGLLKSEYIDKGKLGRASGEGSTNTLIPFLRNLTFKELRYCRNRVLLAPRASRSYLHIISNSLKENL